jgi:hypothetical protein
MEQRKDASPERKGLSLKTNFIEGMAALKK